MGTSTPWGPADSAQRIARGIMEYTTPSHGGIHLSAGRLAEMPESWRSVSGYAPGWYEEDCAWALPVLWFPYDFTVRHLEHALETAEHWYPELLADFTSLRRLHYDRALASARAVEEYMAAMTPDGRIFA